MVPQWAINVVFPEDTCCCSAANCAGVYKSMRTTTVGVNTCHLAMQSRQIRLPRQSYEPSRSLDASLFVLAVRLVVKCERLHMQGSIRSAFLRAKHDAAVATVCDQQIVVAQQRHCSTRSASVTAIHTRPEREK